MASDQEQKRQPGFLGRIFQALVKKGPSMSVRQIDANYFVAGQISPENVSVLANNGFSTVICIRPDGEGWQQPTFAEIENAANACGVEAHYLPVGGGVPPEHAKKMKTIMSNAKGKVLGYCASGNRATMLYQLAR